MNFEKYVSLYETTSFPFCKVLIFKTIAHEKKSSQENDSQAIRGENDTIYVQPNTDFHGHELTPKHSTGDILY